MPKKKIIDLVGPVSDRPHRNMKAKVVFDPSDIHIPKKKNKYSFKKKKPIAATTVKKTTNGSTKKQDTTRSVNSVTESLDSLSTEIKTISPIHSTGKSVTQKTSKNCFICSKISGNTELIDCPICLIKAHRHCLIVVEPMWKFKLDICPWFCKQCRKENCNKCLKDESQSKIQRRCITCEVGLHIICYESYEIKPLQKISNDMYVCFPCLTLATRINPEEEEDIVGAVNDNADDDVESCSMSIVSLSSDKDDTDSKSNGSNSSDYEQYDEILNNEIPNISKWTKDEVFGYLKEVLPQNIIDQIIKYELDGHAFQSLKREEIVSNMGLKLGHALKIYKQVRILQTQSTVSRIFWE
ncbi:histone-lysine N-methyltransferase 2A-like [Myzus persicae]|uniref:histone-lysine N-methyltransferase 2A-like n=1 Tax=Myzus persicae TaxID=13164 RepID=UPI000B9371B8|nr:histone-lysine N-methyltransferase 2A-like [Myzus persicae]